MKKIVGFISFLSAILMLSACSSFSSGANMNFMSQKDYSNFDYSKNVAEGQYSREINDVILRIEKNYEDFTDMDRTILTEIYNQYPGRTDEEYKKLLECRRVSGGIITNNPKTEAEILGLDKPYSAKMTLSVAKGIFARAYELEEGKRGEFVLSEFNKICLPDEAGGSGIDHEIYKLDSDDSSNEDIVLFMLSGGGCDNGLSVWADYRRYDEQGNCLSVERIFN